MKIKQGQFTVTKFLGDGTFGRVLEVVNDNRYYAMKCIRAVDRYIQSAKIETKILWHIQEKDKDGKYQIVKLYTTFERYENYFMIFERLGKSLYDILKCNNYVGFPITYVQAFAKQLLLAVGFLHQNNLTHTDLKPENILTVCQKYIPTMYKLQKIYLPETDKIKLIDLGGATFDNEHHSTLINTRQYRAPEVIMAYPARWNCQSDLWCIACVLMELYTGNLYYQSKDDIEHLAMIEKTLGPIQKKFYQFSKYGHYFSKEIKENNQSCLKWPQSASSDQQIERVRKMKTIDDLIPPKHGLFADLIKQLMKYNYAERISCSQALQHPFFKQQYED